MLNHEFLVFGPGVVYDAEPAVMAQQLKFVRHGLKGDMYENGKFFPFPPLIPECFLKNDTAR